MKHLIAIAPFLAALLLPARAATPPTLPIYLEDSHAGSFFHLAATLDLDQPHALVLIDTHTDASVVHGSDRIRQQLRQVRSHSERLERIEQWRRDGSVQAFDWIEPLMPLPFSSVWWVAPDSVKDDAQVGRDFLDARLGFEKRECGTLGDRFHRVELADLKKSLPAGLPVVVSLDLDYFAAMSPEEIDARFATLWSEVLTLPHLAAITLCVSRPWLRDDTAAFDLCGRAIAASLALRNATLRFEPFAFQGPDRSERAKEFYAAGRGPPRFDLTKAPPALRSLLLANSARIEVKISSERWENLLADWRSESGAWRIAADDSQPSTDGIWRLDRAVTLRVQSQPRQPIPARIRWIAKRPELLVYNVLPEVPGSKAFASTAPPLVRDVEKIIATSEDGTLPADVWQPLLDKRTGWGSVRLAAEISTDGKHWQRTPEIELRVIAPDVGRFRAALSEQFNLPYIFGAGFLRQGGDTGPETGAGNDCANFLIYAWRRDGHRLRWSDPVQMGRQLERIGTDLDLSSQTPIPEGAIERGLAIRATAHAAAVWEDSEPLGVLDANDLMAHHLSGPPELITLRELLAARPSPNYEVFMLPAREPSLRLVAGGDINLHGVKENPLGELPDFLREADLAIANLECALTLRETPQREKPFLFRNVPAAADWLRDAGLDAVSLANNHSGDFGPAGRRDTAAALQAAQLTHFGTNTPWTAGNLVFLGVDFIENPDITNDLLVLKRQLAEAKFEGATTIVMPHWGQEYSPKTTATQRQQARWLIDHGADLIIGAHPHRLQPLDFYRGRPIYYSLGNTFFPGKAGPEGFHQRNWARIAFASDGQLIEAKLE